MPHEQHVLASQLAVEIHLAGGLVVEAGKTIVLEREKLLALAARYRIAVIGRRNQHTAGGALAPSQP